MGEGNRYVKLRRLRNGGIERITTSIEAFDFKVVHYRAI
jgi:hypothetical protein